MKRSDDFVRYTETGLPTVLMSYDKHVLSRNEKALSFSKKFRCRSNLSDCLPCGIDPILQYCTEQGEVEILSLTLPEQSTVSALLVPTRYLDAPCFLLFLFEEAVLSDLPARLSTAVRAAFSAEGRQDAENEFAAEFFTRALRKSYALALTEEDFPKVFSVKHACAFLNRFSKERLLDEGMSISALCTTDCADLPLYNFPRLTALLTCLCLFCLPLCLDREVRVLFFLEREKTAIRLTFQPQADAVKDPALTLDLFEAPLRLLDFQLYKECTAEGMTSLSLICQRTVPAGAIRTDEEQELAERLLPLLLAHIFKG